ncbi:hypothetical protein Poli38472_004516 [Pythium oligandrum]|uniref:ethanolamine kinase n=1 Tax=Pythium oligandrum TaxID=41045 RepID=A0A8K1FH76_PYTOL|nr:hypothetical protein Poli38472_004516 [Pythium oligandrum]|eukprot:TMW59447.1 hypothetical protein Poli38472_004516 [Pythium oligandrum]
MHKAPSSSHSQWQLWVVASAAAVTACTLTTAVIYLTVLRSQTSKHKSHKTSRRRRVRSSSSEEEEEETKETMPVEENKPVVYLNNADACFDYVVGKNDADEFEDVKTVAKAICPEWANADADDIAVKIVSGGITNRLFRLIWREYSVLVRLYGDNTEAFIDRSVENMLFALLSKQGFAPTYHGRFTNGRIEGWMEARPLEPYEMSMTAPINFMNLIGKELGRMHLISVPLDHAPVLWSKIDQFERLAKDIVFPNDAAKRAGLENLNLASVSEDYAWLKSILPSALNQNGKDLVAALADADEITKQAFAFANEVVFCHNDALSGNILHNDAWDRVQIIDYEYGGYNFRGFDFANHFCEHCGFEMDLNLYPGPEAQFTFFRGYMEAAAPELLASLEANKESKAFFHALYPIVNRYALASHLFWGFWAVVQAAHSKIDFDFLDYANKRFSTFRYHRTFFAAASTS